MSKTNKAFLYNFFGFAIIYFIVYFGIKMFLPNISWYWFPISAAVAGSLLAPKFQVVKNTEGEKLYMKFIFIKGIREID